MSPQIARSLGFRRALTLTALTAVAPGSAQVLTGRRRVGYSALAIWVLTVVGLMVVVWRARSDLAGTIAAVADADTLLVARFAILVLAVGWVSMFLDAWRSASSAPLDRPRTVVVAVLNVALLAGVAGSAAYVSQVLGVSREVVTQVFDDTETSEALEGRFNILLIGSDSGDGRFGIRPDSLTVASIDADTGRTVLVSLPRNLENVPFRDDSPMQDLYPDGFNCGDECLLNAVHTVVEERTDLYPGSEDPGLDATIDAVEGVTDLTINYHVMVNLGGFSSLVDAVGGIDMDIKAPIAMFGQDDAYKQEYIKPGVQTLDGNQALWYARSRVQSNDFTRMGRQKCLMSAMLEQLSPQTVLLNASRIADSSKNLVSTDIPATELGQFADLTLKARGKQISSVSLVPPVVNTSFPDFDVIHQLIADAIDGPVAPTATPDSTPTQEDPGTPSPSPEAGEPTDDDLGDAANNADDLRSIC
ncbi:LCP family protein [Aeromicrobium sp. CF3.5]|uniref:LCP family protein n=1 Tax=Aeromicrobium sp. CF3.5 TaxID=3373078 RepID=UPI003EE7BCF4